MPSLPLVDTHAHIDDPAFDADRAEVVRRAADAGVTRIVVIGYREEIWQRASRVAREIPGGAVCLGIHPGSADEYAPGVIDRLEEAARASGAVAIGETGIDLFHDGPALAVQQDAFRAQLGLANRLGVPTVIHQRAAETECLAILRETPPDQPIMLHSFDAGQETAEVARERGWYLGVGGLMTRRSNVVVREILREFPLDRIVLETDSPYLVPAGIRGRRNEPANVTVIAQRLADLRGIPVDEVSAATTANAKRLFRLDAGLDATAES